MATPELDLGRRLADGAGFTLDPDHLTTHAVCLGMTGSGKTGLGVVVLEELARRRVPLLVIDLKGDMVNLLLNFPGLTAEEFAPWLPADAVADRDRLEAAAELAERWRSGLEGSGLGRSDLEAVRDGVGWQLLTPGAAAVAPLDILPALSAPEGWDPDSDPDGAAQRVNGLSVALLSLIGRGGDPLTDRDTVFLAAVILEHWRRRDRLDLVRLLGSVADPPLESFGALPLESFFPRKDRMELVLALNTLLASPAFQAWTQGIPMTMEALLGTRAEPRASIISVAHLDERQRLFVLSLLLSELLTWTRRQPASAGLRALLYLDEVQGILPPHPANPPTKGPLLTLLKQGRAFGVGAWLATQNPVDLDYKALGNAGVKVVGRLTTDRDRDRALEGLDLRRLPDGRDPEDVVTGLGKRQFLVVNVRADERVSTFTTRWAMSYLRGPVTLAEMKPLVGARDAAGAGRVRTPEAPREAPEDTGSTRPPVVASPVPVRFVAGGAGPARPTLRVRCRTTVERRSFDLLRTIEEDWWVPVVAPTGLDWEGVGLAVGSDPLADEPPDGMRFPASLPAGLDDDLGKADAAFVSWRTRQPVTVLANAKLKVAAAVDETVEQFRERCLQLADRADDDDQERAKARFERRMDSVRRRLDRERGELERDEVEARSRAAEEKLGVVEGLFSVLLGSRSVRSAARKVASKARSTATKRRMRQRAEASVVESEREIARLEEELEELGLELQDEVDRIAAASEEAAAQVEELAIRPKRADVEVLELALVWTCE